MKNWIVGALVVLAWGCGDDSGGGAAACPKGTMALAKLPCTCGDAGTTGTQVCQADMKLGACDCNPPDGGTGGNASATTGGTGGSTVGTGGSGGTPAVTNDAGMMTTDGGVSAGGDGGTTVAPLPTDGNQLAMCANGTDCNMGLDCNQAGGGADFCTKVCAADTDCATIPGATWTCSLTGGLCEVACTATTDTMSCPAGLECLRIGGFGGGTATFRCKGVVAAVTPPPVTMPFVSCTSSMACGTGSICVGAGMGRTGYCTTTCMNDMDCAALTTSSGNLTATCEFGALGMGAPSNCALNCDRPADVCPDGMMCRMGVGAAPSLCGY